MSNMNFNCDVCGREVQGCTLVNGMKFCAKCYQETFGETEKDRKIADLQSQLAEKDKEIERLKELVMHKTYNRNAAEARLNYEQNQKAIEELERLKSAILSERNTTYFKFDNFNKGKDTAYYWVNEIIDNQIKSLRGEK